MLNKKILIISPYFPPSNAADMQRVRLSLPYFNQFGWEAEVVTVDVKYTELAKDNLLLESIPDGIKIHRIKALSLKLTRRLGLGSLAIRALPFYRQKVNALLRNNKYDLIYFSTTQFAVCLLGPYWKRKYGVPYVIDLQDPWHSDYYQDKPKNQRPPKYWFSYRLNRYLEPIVMRKVDGLISVSMAYLHTLTQRYQEVKNVPSAVIPFGFNKADMAIAAKHQTDFTDLLAPEMKNLVYLGRGGEDMHKSIIPVFKCLQTLLAEQIVGVKSIRLYFIGTSYAPDGKGKQTIWPLAKSYGLGDYVTEITDRISFYHALNTLQLADALFVPGSDDPKYTPSKLYPYLLTEKPLLAVLNPQSPALTTLRKCGASYAYSTDEPLLLEHLKNFLKELCSGTLPALAYAPNCLVDFDAMNMTRLQCNLFDQVIH